MNTHYAVIVFDGDFDEDHPDPELRGECPSMTLVACGSEEFCWDAIEEWTQMNPLRRDETAEVVVRDPVLAAQEAQMVEGED